MKFLKIFMFCLFLSVFSFSLAEEKIQKEIIYSKTEIVVQIKENKESSLLSDFPDSKKILLNFYSVKVPEGKKVEEFLKEIQRKDYIKDADFNYGYKLDIIPDDYYFNSQWGLQKVKAPEAWDYTTGSTDVYVAVIDDGVDFRHLDLQDNIWKNPNEICDNGKDDDKNGYIDDCYGWSAIEGKGSAVPKGSHGTHVAGIIGAVGNNLFGVAGVNWNVGIIPCGAGTPEGFLYDIAIAECFGYIQKLKYLKGLNIVAINASWGGYGRSKLANKVLEILKQYDILLVAAAGNESNNNDEGGLYPCSYDSETVICVGASDRYDFKANFSNYGASTVDIFAPGVDILSTTTYGYDSYSGTSMATPFVTGAVALTKAFYPFMNYAEIRKKIISSGDFITNLKNYCISGKRLNLKKIVNGYSSATYNFNPSYYWFFNVNLGEEKSKVFYVISTGEQPLTINSVELSNTEDFYIKSENCTGKNLNFYEKCQIEVVIKPVSGHREVKTYLTINSNGENTTRAKIDGSVNINPIAKFEPEVLIFKSVQPGESETKEVQLKNIGTGILVIKEFINSGASPFEFDYSDCSPLPFNLKAGESCKIKVKYTPVSQSVSHAAFTVVTEGSYYFDNSETMHIHGTTELLPDLQINKKEFYFKAPMGEVSEPQVVEIHNKGKINLEITNISFTNSSDVSKQLLIDFNDGFKPCGSKVVIIPPNDYCTFSIRYKPLKRYEKVVADLWIFSNDRFYKSPLVATIEATPLDVEIAVSPNEIYFEGIQVDDVSDFKDITIKNSSEINEKLLVKKISLDNNTDFILDKGTCGNTPFELIKDESCQIKVKFNPKSEGKKKAKVKIVSNDYERANYYVRLEGKGYKKSPEIEVVPERLDFGDVQVGMISDEKIITIKNIGMLPLRVFSLEIEDSTYLINYRAGSNPCGSEQFTIQPKTNCTIGVRFAPNEEDDFKGKIKIKTDGDSGDIALYGNGTRGIPPKINLSTEYLDFGKVVINTTKTAEIVISNTAKNSNLIVNRIDIDDKQNFALNFNGGSNPCGSSSFILPAKSQCTIQISFVPSKNKRFKTYLEIKSNDPEEDKLKLKIYGEGTFVPVPKMVLDKELNFGALQVGHEKTKQIEIKNIGEGNLVINEIKLKSDAFVINPNYGTNPCKTLSPVIPPNNSCTLGIKFKPYKDKSFKEKMDIRSNDPYSKKNRVYIYGKGTNRPEGYLYIGIEDIDFGAVSIGNEKIKEVKLYNLGEDDLKITDMYISDSTFEIITGYGTNPCNSMYPTIQANTFCTIGIKFKPDDDGKFKSKLNIKTEEDKIKIKLIGRGTKEGQPFILVEPVEVHFEDTLVGSSDIKEIYIKNIGEKDLKINQIKTSDQKIFELISNYGTNPCNSVNLLIPPDSMCTIGVKFKPNKEKRFKEYLEIVSNTEKLKINMYGSGWEHYPPKINLTPYEYDFGKLKVGNNPAKKVIKIENNGKGILNIYSIENKSSDFYIDFSGGSKPCGTSKPSIIPNDYCTFEVVFNPKSKGKKKTTIKIVSNDKENEKIKLRFYGEALPSYGKISVSPMVIRFSETEVILVGYSSDFEKITIKNSGSDNLFITEIDMSDEKNFILDPNYGNDKPCKSLTPIVKPGDYCTIHIAFRPVEKVSSVKNCENGYCEEKVTARIKFISNDENEYKPEIKIFADSAEIPDKRFLYIDPKTYDFEFTDVGQSSKPVEIKLENHNESEIVVDEISYKNLGDFILDYNGGSKPCGNFPVKLGIKDYCTITAIFKPTSEGYKEASFSVKGDTPYKINEKVVLTGRTTKNEPYIKIEPRYIDFEENFVKTLSSIREVKITNIGSQDLIINDIQKSSEYVHMNLNDGSNPCGNTFPIVLSKDEYCTFTVTFEPKAEKRKTTKIKVKSNDPYNSKYEITVTGTGILPPYPPGGCSFSPTNAGLPLYLLVLIFLILRNKFKFLIRDKTK